MLSSCDAPTPIPQYRQHRQHRAAHTRVAAVAVAAYRDEQQQLLQQQQQQATATTTTTTSSSDADGSHAQAVTTTTACDEVTAQARARAAAAATVMLTAVPAHTPLAVVRRVCAWLHAACDGDVDAMHRLLTANNNNNNNNNNDDEVPDLLNACGQPDPRAYAGVPFRKRWTYTAPALVYAASFGRERAVSALLQWGADPHTRSSTGLRAREYAEARGYVAIATRLRDAEDAAQ